MERNTEKRDGGPGHTVYRLLRLMLKFLVAGLDATADQELPHRASACQSRSGLVRDIAMRLLLRNLFPGVAYLRRKEVADPILYVGRQSQRRLRRHHISEDCLRAGRRRR